jgi:hypothetical protein
MFKKGDILLPSERIAKEDWLNGLFHPAIVWDEIYDGTNDFSGIMITHSQPTKNFNNILMAANHFETGYEVTFSNSHFVNQVFIKFQNWGPFELVGKLTTGGIHFIEKNLSENSGRIEFVNYRASILSK